MTEEMKRVIDHQRERLEEKVIERIYKHHPAICQSPSGNKARQKSLQDVRDHLIFFSHALALDDPSLFAKYSAWNKVLFSNLKFTEEAWPVTLRSMEYVLIDHLGEDKKADRDIGKIKAYFEKALHEVKITPVQPPSHIQEGNPYQDLASSYLESLLNGKRHAAREMILQAVQNGASTADIYLYIFTPVQHEICRLWQTNQVNVAQAHYCTAATQVIVSRLYPYIFNAQRNGQNMVMTCVGGELHELGDRMVADLFAMEGWDSYNLGANYHRYTFQGFNCASASSTWRSLSSVRI